jgi:hypothetical protein
MGQGHDQASLPAGTPLDEASIGAEMEILGFSRREKQDG